MEGDAAMSGQSSNKEEIERSGKGRRETDTLPFNVLMFKILAWSLLALQGVAVYLYTDLKSSMNTRISQAEYSIAQRSSQGDVVTSAKIAALEATINSLDNKKVDLQLFNLAIGTINSNNAELGRKMDKMLDMHIKQGYR
jgi:hypothetical protein